MGRPYSNEELLRKAAVAIGDITSGGGKLQPEQLDQFLRITQVSQAILREARVEVVSRGQKLLDRTGMTSRFLRPGIEDDTSIYTDASTRLAKEAVPTLAQISLTTKKVSGQSAVSWETLQRNIEKEGFADTLVEILAERAAFDLEDMGVNGDTDLDDSTILDLVDGFLKKVPAAQALDWGHAVFNRNVFLRAINSVPARFRRNISEFRFYVSHGIELAYRDLLAQRGTVLGDVSMTEDGSLKAYGVPVVGVDVMPNNLGTGSDEGVVLFAHPKNLIWAIEDEIRILDQFDRYRDALVLFFHASVDCTVEEVNAIAKVTGIKWNLGGS
jgi:HK97 family phage major capsid protein